MDQKDREARREVNAGLLNEETISQLSYLGEQALKKRVDVRKKREAAAEAARKVEKAGEDSDERTSNES
jgi:hypothetical protein